MKFNLPDTLVLKPNQDFEIEAKVTPVNKGYFGSSLKFKSSHPDYPVIDLPGSSVVKDPASKK